ncbi:MAG: OmpA family protein [Gammaproteobacteria bacterium]|nr:OmpA family protein [Gammaproteobacteria bacterium]
MKNKVTNTGLLLACLLASVSAMADNEVRRTFFKDADAALEAANAVNAKLLAPDNYEEGMEAYTEAEKDLARGRDIGDVRDGAAEAVVYFREAERAAKLAKTVLGQVIKSRQDAESAGAPEQAPKIWKKAQDKFESAVTSLEGGNLARAKERDIEATILFRDAELVAIKAQYLSETRKLIADADKARIKRYAPLTLDKAKSLLAEAEKELNENRYDADRPRSLAMQANYEVKHAFYLSKVVRAVDDDDLSVEQLVLEWEDPLIQIAGAADVSPAMSNGHDTLQDALIAYIENMRNDNQSLQQQLSANEIRLADMETQMQALDEQLGGATKEREALTRRLEAQARVKEQFDKVEKMFTKSEARVFREGNDIILRMVGLTFDSGKSDIRPAAYNLLSKAQQAVALFPGAQLVIEGHTDSYGGDDLNQRLSQDRAASVQQHIAKAMGIPADRVSSIGYGETRPVANNETAAGRAKNRRIDIVIKPNLEG